MAFEITSIWIGESGFLRYNSDAFVMPELRLKYLKWLYQLLIIVYSMVTPAPPVGEFLSCNVLIEHVRIFGAMNGFGISITKFKPNVVYLACD
ncbi:8061_t:CDS:2 [Gigaspora rosea]|nr:8061_t:CDS:2 [Gigaspora rosea]